jgi:hypothetical protein
MHNLIRAKISQTAGSFVPSIFHNIDPRNPSSGTVLLFAMFESKTGKRVYVSSSSSAACSGSISAPLHRVDDDGGRTRGAMCPSTGSPYPVVVFSRHQYERAPAMACDLDSLPARGLLKRAEFAQELQNRRRGHSGRPVF